MLSPDAKTIWKSKAGGSLMAAMLGSRAPTGEDEETMQRLLKLSQPGADAGEDDDAPPVEPAPMMAADKAMQGQPRSRDRLAFDRATVRIFDADGRLHVKITNISKAAVNPYMGREIPGSEELGLDPDRIYQLLRDPAELERGAPTFNNLPLLDKHTPVSAAKPEKDLIVGSSGTDAAFEAPYLRNSLVIWDAAAIQGVESGDKRELSCAYRYTPVMEPGVYEGARYDGRMTNLIGNHIALVEAGRAGSDVIVGDSQLEEPPMKKVPLSRRAVLAKGALLGTVLPILAADAKPDFDAILAGVTAANWKAKKAGIAAAIKPMLANDADLQGVVKLLDALEGEGGGEGGQGGMPPGAPGADPSAPPASIVPPDKEGEAIDADPCAEVLDMLRGQVPDELLAQVEAKMREAIAPPAAADPLGAPPAEAAEDSPPPEPGVMPPPDNTDPLLPKKDTPAMDAASITKLVANATAAAQAKAREAAEAARIARPWVGELVAMDSAEQVFKAALDALGVKTEGVHPSAFRHILEAQPKPGSDRVAPIAMDASQAGGSQSLLDRIPGLSRVTAH